MPRSRGRDGVHSFPYIGSGAFAPGGKGGPPPALPAWQKRAATKKRGGERRRNGGRTDEPSDLDSSDIKPSVPVLPETNSQPAPGETELLIRRRQSMAKRFEVDWKRLAVDLPRLHSIKPNPCVPAPGPGYSKAI